MCVRLLASLGVRFAASLELCVHVCVCVWLCVFPHVLDGCVWGFGPCAPPPAPPSPLPLARATPPPSAQVSHRAHKMSKSRGNVVNPDDVVWQYGADSLRLYEMFMGPLRDTKVRPGGWWVCAGGWRLVAGAWWLGLAG